MNSTSEIGEDLQKVQWTPLLGVLIATIVAVVFFLVQKLRQRKRREEELWKYPSPHFENYYGLSDEEAESRFSPEIEETRKKEARQVRWAIWRTSTFSIINLSLVGLAVVHFLLSDLIGALGSLLVLLLSIVLTAVQQLYATGHLEKLLHLAQPMATVIRSGQIKSDVAAMDEADINITLQSSSQAALSMADTCAPECGILWCPRPLS